MPRASLQNNGAFMFEYKIIEYLPTEDGFNELGKDSWELINIITKTNGYNEMKFKVIFKRLK